MTGTIVNALAIICGAALGVFFKRAIPDKYKMTIMQGIGLSVVVIGIMSALKTKNPLLMISSLVIGGIVGEYLQIEERLNITGQWLEKKLGSYGGDASKGFVTATLVYCIGAMAIMGSLQDGLTGDSTTLFIKSILDGVSSIIFASTLGIGVAFSAVPVFLYQGAISITATVIQPFLQPNMINELEATGGLLIMGVGINVLGIMQIRVANLLPGVFIALLAARFIPSF